MSGLFKCAECGKTYEKAWSDNEAKAECEDIFCASPDKEECAIICDDCFCKMRQWMGGAIVQ